MKYRTTPRISTFTALALLVLSTATQAQSTTVDASTCGTPTHTPGAFGPVDYRKATPQERSLVETYHFTPGIETMTKPKTTDMQNMAADVAYVLDVLPNHPRALRTMWRLSNRDGKNPANSGRLTVECWFDRAIRFALDDPIPRLLFAQYLLEKNRKEEALNVADSVLPLASDNPFTHYNLGLTYFDLGAYDKAAKQAVHARELGMPREDLVEKLKRVGKWTDTPPPEDAKPAPQ